MLAASLVAAACIVFSVTFRIFDTDFWQHLLVGRVIWEQGAIPHQHLWSWVTYGRPEVLPSWLFRALLWPFYDAGGVMGLYVWRWVTTLAVFALLWVTARRLGARGFLPLLVLVWCALIYRGRTQLRPETLAAVLIGLELWILETRRARLRAGEGPLGWRDPVLWLVPIVWVWVNSHVSYFIAFVLLGIHALDGLAGGSGAGRKASRMAALRPLVGVGLVMLAAALLNPFGWQYLWLPFDYAVNLSQETMYRHIAELMPLSWAPNARNGVWIMIVLWPVLALWRARRHGLDLAELLTCALATAYTLPSQRFVGVYAVLAAPYLARDVEAWVRERRWPSWTARPAARAALVSAACVAISVPELLRAAYPPGIGIELQRFPVAASDFMERHQIRGRGFSHFHSVGYLTWRFWPQRDRLPFTDIHQSGTPEDRQWFADAFLHPGPTWPRLAERYRLDYAVLDRRVPSGTTLLDVIDADTAWAMVFLDDDAALYVNRRSLRAVADSFGFGLLGGGSLRLARVGQLALADTTMWRPLRGELERAASGSPWNATAHRYLSNLALVAGNHDEAAAHLRRVVAVDPQSPGVHRSLALVALWQRRPRDAVVEFQRELRSSGRAPGVEMGLGMAWEQIGDKRRARAHYERELANDPGNSDARARLDSLSLRP